MNFQDELRRNLRTPEEVNRETMEKRTEAQMVAAELTLSDIKKALVSKAQKADYSVQNGITTVSCLCRISPRFLLRNHKNNGKELEQDQKKPRFLRDPNLVYCTWECFTVNPQFSHEYYPYIEMVKNLAARENIQIEVVIHDATTNKVYPFPTELKNFYSVHCYLCIRASTVVS